MLIQEQAVKSRNFGLDLMRATAIVLVLGAHAFHIIAPHISKSISFISLPDGVDLFFVLSGFLVGGIWLKIMDNQKPNAISLLKSFFWRRWLRTIPAYVVVLSFLFILRWIHSDFTFQFPWRYYLFIQSVFTPEWDPYYFYPEAWSLSVEEWFYVLMPLLSLLMLMFVRSAKQSVLFFSLAIIMLPFLFRILFYVNHPITSLDDWNRYIRHITIYRFDMIGFGVLAAWLKFYKATWWSAAKKHKWLGVTLLILSTIGYHFYAFGFVFLSLFYFSFMGIGLLLVMPTIETITCSQPKISNGITALSVIAYSIYLLHRTVILHLLFLPFKPHFALSLPFSLALYFLYIAATIFISYWFYRIVEKPVMDFRERFNEKI